MGVPEIHLHFTMRGVIQTVSPLCTKLTCHVLKVNHVLKFGYTLQTLCGTDLDLLRQNNSPVQNNRLNVYYGVFRTFCF